MGRVAALVKYYMNGLIPFLEENRTNKKSNAPSPKTITAANKQKDYKLTKAAIFLKLMPHIDLSTKVIPVKLF